MGRRPPFSPVDVSREVSQVPVGDLSRTELIDTLTGLPTGISITRQEAAALAQKAKTSNPLWIEHGDLAPPSQASRWWSFFAGVIVGAVAVVSALFFL